MMLKLFKGFEDESGNVIKEGDNVIVILENGEQLEGVVSKFTKKKLNLKIEDEEFVRTYSLDSISDIKLN